ncbi:MAG: ATP synthase F0 subunit C [Coriobacteriia bacterium]
MHGQWSGPNGGPDSNRGGIVNVIGYGLAVIGASLAIGLVGGRAAEATARQPEMAGRVFTVFILGAAFAEALALLGFVLALIK